MDRGRIDSRVPCPVSPVPVSALRRCRQPVPARVIEGPLRRPLRVSSERRGFAGGAVVSCAGPWRTSGAWWEDAHESHKSEVASRKSGERGPAAPKPAMNLAVERGPVSPKPVENSAREGGWSRDEWDVAMADGTVYRIFRDRTTAGWFIEGTFD